MFSSAVATLKRDLVFVSYSHEDRKYLDDLEIILKPYISSHQLKVWADPYIEVGGRWEREIDEALARTRVAILLVSPTFLASDFILEREFAPLLEAASEEHLTLIPVPVSACGWEATALKGRQWARDPEKPLDQLRRPRRNQALKEIAQKIAEAAKAPAEEVVSRAPAMAYSHQTSCDRLGAGTGSEEGGLHGVPNQRPHYVPRASELERLRASLLAGSQKIVGVTGSASLQGWGGIGKTVMAIAAARDETVRRAFGDGIFWLGMGEKPDLLGLQSRLAGRLGGSATKFDSVTAGREHLQELLRERSSMIVLDDVWKADALVAFDVLGARTRLLVTTRHAEILRGLKADLLQLDVLSRDSALTLLAETSGQARESLPEDAAKAAEAVGYVPLALSVIGASLREAAA